MKKIIIAAMMLIVAIQIVCAQNEANDSAIIVPPIYDNISNHGGDMLIVEKDNKKGAINFDGKIIVPTEYDNIKNEWGGIMIVEKKNKKGVINSEGKIIVPLEYDDIILPKKDYNCGGLIVVHNKLLGDENRGEKTDSYGLYNTDGELILSPEENNYESIWIQGSDYGYEGLALVSIYTDELRKEIIDDSDLSSNNAPSEIHHKLLKKRGVLLEDGTINTSYDDYSINKGGLIEVEISKSDGEKKGLINKKGEIVVPFKDYRHMYVCKNNSKIIEVIDDDGLYLFNDKGKIIAPVGKYDYFDVGVECIIVEKNKQRGALSLNGVPIISVGLYDKLYEEICDDRINHYISVYKGGKKGAANCEGKVFVPCGKYDSFQVLDNNLIIVTVNNRKGIINRNGVVVVPVGKYSNISYKYGVIYYSNNGKYGIIDKNGKQATLAIYDYIEIQEATNGIAIVSEGGKIGAIDSEGHTINGQLLTGLLVNSGTSEYADTEYGRLKVLRNSSNKGLFIIESKGKKGIVRL